LTTRFDAWLLPFFNAYAIVGYTWADTELALSTEIDLPGPGDPIEVVVPIEVGFEGGTYGLGGTLVGGYGFGFAMVDLNYTWTHIQEFDDKIEKLVVSGRAGMQGGVGRFAGAAWVGAMYIQNEITIGITLPDGGPLAILDGARVEVDQSSDHPVNFIFGGLWEFNRHFQLMLEGGVGHRNQVLVSTSYRF
jgi:hypothetical protein